MLPLSHVFERQAMNMYLHHGMSVYFGSLDTLGENLREVRPTVLVGVPRIYEKISRACQDSGGCERKAERRAGRTGPSQSAKNGRSSRFRTSKADSALAFA